jgi:hypothetical protein
MGGLLPIKSWGLHSEKWVFIAPKGCALKALKDPRGKSLRRKTNRRFSGPFDRSQVEIRPNPYHSTEWWSNSVFPEGVEILLGQLQGDSTEGSRDSTEFGHSSEWRRNSLFPVTYHLILGCCCVASTEWPPHSTECGPVSLLLALIIFKHSSNGFRSS